MAILDRVSLDEERLRDRDAWYLRVPAIADVRANGLALDAPVTVFVGENGVGKSTLIAAIAAAWRRRLTAANTYWGPGPSREDADLHWALTLTGDRPISHGGCFLRAEAMHGLFDSTATDPAAARTFQGGLNTRSHGESFLAFLQSRLTEQGLFILDEPEAALSFTSCLQLLSLMGALTDTGSQVLIATHSPLLAALPGASIKQITDDGIVEQEWGELDLVQHWRTFLARPEDYLRHLFGDER